MKLKEFLKKSDYEKIFSDLLDIDEAYELYDKYLENSDLSQANEYLDEILTQIVFASDEELRQLTRKKENYPEIERDINEIESFLKDAKKLKRKLVNKKKRKI